MFDMSLTYILVALVAVILNNALVEMLSLHTRISVGKSGPLLSSHSHGAPVLLWLFSPPVGATCQASSCRRGTRLFPPGCSTD